MRFISQYPKFAVQARKQRVHPLGDGTVQVVEDGLYVRFAAADDGAMIYERERIFASDYFNFHGSQQEQDEATPVDPIHRLSVVDTREDADKNGWSEEDVELIERELTKIATETPNALFIVQGTPIPAPFPRYDSWSGDAQELVLKLTDDGFDLAEVLLYEQNFGLRRPDVIEALLIGKQALEDEGLTVRG